MAQATLYGIWAKAEEYLKSERDLLPAPGSNVKAMMVTSKSTKIPHYVAPSTNGQYSCDTNCLQWKSSHICAHTVAVAEKNCELAQFLQWYVCSKQEPNITTIGLPSGRGRKGGVPKRKRVRSEQTPELVVARAATQRSPPSTQVVVQGGSTQFNAVGSVVSVTPSPSVAHTPAATVTQTVSI